MRSKFRNPIIIIGFFAVVSGALAGGVIETQERLSPTVAVTQTPPQEETHHISFDPIYAKRHLRWIEGCSRFPISTYKVDNDLAIYATDLGPEGEALFSCLLPNIANELGNQKTFIFDSPIGILYRLESGASYPRPDAFLQTGNKAFIVAAIGSDFGVEQVKQVSGDTFIVQTGYATHSRNYKILGHSGEITMLPNGSIDVLGDGKLLVKEQKSYLENVGGAFWFDAILDANGNILDIITKDGEGHVVCMSRDQLVHKSTLDLSRVIRLEVCIKR